MYIVLNSKPSTHIEWVNIFSLHAMIHTHKSAEMIQIHFDQSVDWPFKTLHNQWNFNYKKWMNTTRMTSSNINNFFSFNLISNRVHVSSVLTTMIWIQKKIKSLKLLSQKSEKRDKISSSRCDEKNTAHLYIRGSPLFAYRLFRSMVEHSFGIENFIWTILFARELKSQ